MDERTNNQERCFGRKVWHSRTERKWKWGFEKCSVVEVYPLKMITRLWKREEIKWLEFVYFLKDSGSVHKWQSSLNPKWPFTLLSSVVVQCQSSDSITPWTAAPQASLSFTISRTTHSHDGVCPLPFRLEWEWGCVFWKCKAVTCSSCVLDNGTSVWCLRGFITIWRTNKQVSKWTQELILLLKSRNLYPWVEMVSEGFLGLPRWH